MKSACNNMESSRSLPILLVSAKDKEAAAAIISGKYWFNLEGYRPKLFTYLLNCGLRFQLKI